MDEFLWMMCVSCFSEPMLVPFLSNVTLRMLPVIGSVIDRLGVLRQTALRSLTHAQAVKIDEIWQALQYELALEKVFWGQTKFFGMDFETYRDLKALARSLGPGHDMYSDTCSTDHQGFLVINDWNSGIGPLSPLPPLGIWTRSNIQVSLE